MSRVDKLAREKGYRNNKTTGVAGICYKRNGYEISIGVNKKQIYIGRAKNLKEAIKIRNSAIERYHTPLIKKHEELLKGE